MNPYIPLTCEEVLAIKELSNYAKTRVRLFGRLQICQSKRGIEFRTLQSLGEELESKVLIDFSYIIDKLDNFEVGQCVQILGDLCQVDATEPVFLKALIIRDFSGVDARLYHEAIAAQLVACPRGAFNAERNHPSPKTGDTPKLEVNLVSNITSEQERQDESDDFFESSVSDFRKMPKTMFVTPEGPSNALHLDCNRDFSHVVIAGRTIFKIYRIDEDAFTETLNLRSGKNINLNYSCNDVAWSPTDETLVATAATNGAVVIWKLDLSSKSKQHHVFSEHTRTVNKVHFHPSDTNMLVSGSQDGIMKLFDIRSLETVAQFVSNNESVRDVQFNPHSYNQLASVSENGKVQLWDTRRCDRVEKWWTAHLDNVYACDWHPEVRGCLATAGRDKCIKIWDTSLPKVTQEHSIFTIGPVGKVKWRPQRREHIGSSALVINDINVWDIRRPYLPFATFEEHKDVATGILWRGDPYLLLSTSKDGTLFQHAISDASRPADRANTSCIAINSRGDISHAYRDAESVNMSTISEKMNDKPFHPGFGSTQAVKTLPPEPNQPAVTLRVPNMFRRVDSVSDLFCASASHLKMYTLNEEAIRFNKDIQSLTDMRWLVDTAKRYVLCGESFEDMCDHNAAVAFSLSRHQVAQTWSTLKTLFGKWPDSTLSEVTGHLSLEDESVAKSSVEHDIQERHRHASCKGKHQSTGMRERLGTGDLKFPPGAVGPATTSESGEGVVQTTQQNGGRVRRSGADTRHGSGGSNGRRKSAGGLSGQSESDEDDEELPESNELTLTKIASGKMLANNSEDFFGDSELAELTFEYPVALEAAPFNYNYNGQGGYNSGLVWDLPSEAFDLRHEIRESSSHAEAEEFAQNEDDSINEDSTVTVTVEDQTSALLCCVEANAQPAWSASQIVKDTLRQYAETGDIQTTVSVYIVLGYERVKSLIDDATVEEWFMAYIELLQRFNLINTASEILNLCPFASVNQMNHQSTTFYSNCTACNKALSLNQCAWWCERCRVVPNSCSICHQVVKGLFAWCQGCGHGGHIHHIEQWLALNDNCPSGCGHICEYE